MKIDLEKNSCPFKRKDTKNKKSKLINKFTNIKLFTLV